MRLSLATCLMVVSGLIAPGAAADLLRLKNGETLRGTIVTRTSKEVVVKLDFGTMSFAPEDIVAVEAESPPEEEATEPSPAAAPDIVESEAPPRPAAEASASTPATPAKDLVLSEALKAVVFIGVLSENGALGIGSGTLINDKGTLVTNYHVVGNATKIAVLLPGHQQPGSSKSPRPYEARLLKTDPCYDLALVSIPVKTPEYFRFAEDGSIHVGDEVRAIGNPQGLAASVSKGIISAVRTLKDLGVEDLKIPECEHLSGRTVEAATLVQTDAAINPGNSGGPLLNSKNEIVGINTMGLQQSGDAGLNFALHVKHVRRFVGSYAKR